MWKRASSSVGLVARPDLVVTKVVDMADTLLMDGRYEAVDPDSPKPLIIGLKLIELVLGTC